MTYCRCLTHDDRHADATVPYLPGPAMRRAANLYPGTAKTDARDAFAIADTARTMPHIPRRVDAGEETLAELKVLTGFDQDLTADATRLSNRIRDLLTQIHSALEGVIGSRLTTKKGLVMTGQLGGPQGMAAASKSPLFRVITKTARRGPQEFAEAITQALRKQTVTVAGTTAAGQVLPKLVASLRQVLQQRAELAVPVEKVVDAHSLAEDMALDVGEASLFPTAGHLPAHANPAPSAADPEPASAASSPPGPGTDTRNNHCFCQPPPPYVPTPSAVPTTTTNEPRANDTTPHSSAYPDAAATSCSPRSEPATPTGPRPEPRTITHARRRVTTNIIRTSPRNRR